MRHSGQATSAARNILEVDIPESRNPGEEVSVVREMMVEARDLFFDIGGRELLEGTEKVDAGLYARVGSCVPDSGTSVPGGGHRFKVGTSPLTPIHHNHDAC